MREIQVSGFKRYGWTLVIGIILWIALHYFNWQYVELNVWVLFFLFGVTPIFTLDRMFADLVRRGSASHVVFPEFTSSSSSRVSTQSLRSGPENVLPPTEAVLHGGANHVFALRDKTLAIVPRSAVRLFGKDKNVRLIYSPVSPVTAKALGGYFGSVAGIAQQKGFVKPSSRGWLGLLNSQWGEDHQLNMRYQEAFALKLEMMSRRKEVVLSEEEVAIEAMRMLAEETQGKPSKIAEKLKGFWRSK